MSWDVEVVEVIVGLRLAEGLRAVSGGLAIGVEERVVGVRRVICAC